MDQPRAHPCICGSTDHAAIRDGALLRCPERTLPAYVVRGASAVALGVCWAEDPDSGLHCTQPPHGEDTDHRNAYAGRPWRIAAP
jgi:hypothetical protein